MGHVFGKLQRLKTCAGCLDPRFASTKQIVKVEATTVLLSDFDLFELRIPYGVTYVKGVFYVSRQESIR